MRRTIVLLATVMTMGSLLAGCGDGDGDGEDSPADFPAGRYEATGVGSSDVFVTFNGGGGLIIENPGGFNGGAWGSYVVDEAEVTITARLCGRRDAGRHRYTWTWDGALLKMAPIGNEGCADRRTTLAEMKLVEAFEQLVGDFPFGAYESAHHEPGSEWVNVAFYGDGFLMVENEHSGSGGSYVVTGNSIEITGACLHVNDTARYEWAWDGTQLTMTPLGEDGCVDRRTALAQMTQVEAFPPDQRYLW